MTKTARRITSFQTNEATDRQIDALKTAGFGGITEIVRTAIDRMYQQEIKTMNTTVTNRNNKPIDFAAAVNLMDDDTREQLANRQEWHSNQEFFTAYEQAHEQKYGEEWELSKSNPVW